MTEWFERWFGEEYLELYPHRDTADAERAITLVARVAPLEGRRVLDLACGPGRHAGRLIERGARVVGIDLSMPLLRRAQHAGFAVTGLVRGDMRHLPFAKASFDVVVNLFTSFGYFSSDDQHRQAVSQMAAVLAPGGTLVMDYLNASRVRAHLVEHEETVIGSRPVIVDRRLEDDERYVVKEMRLIDDGRCFNERVRLFSAGDLADLMRGQGLHVTQTFGDYDGSPPTPDSPRAILVAERT